MAGTTRRNTKKSVTFGILGLANASTKSIEALLEDRVAGVGEATFILPATKEHYSESVEVVADWLSDNDIPFEVVIDDSSDGRTFKALIRDAKAAIKATNVGTAVVNRLKEADEAELLLFWDEKLGDDDGGAYDAMEYAEENDIACYDLTKGLTPLSFKNDDDRPAEEEPEPAVAEEKPRRTRRAKVEPEPEVEAEDDEAGGEAEDGGLPPYKEAARYGIRKLRDLAEARGLGTRRAIGRVKTPGELLDLIYPDGPDGATQPARKGPQPPPLSTLEEEISAAAHEVHHTSALNGEASAVLDQLVDLLAVRVAARVKELVDA